MFNKQFQDEQITLQFHVDDFKGFCILGAGLDHVYDILLKAFTTVTQTTGKIINYLGMVYDYTNPAYVAATYAGFV